MRRFAAGVTVLTCRGPDGPEGITVSAFTSVSLRPPQVLVCLARGSRTLSTILTEGRFAVNVLGWQQRELATRFADRTRTPAQRFAGIAETTLVTGSPVVLDALASLDCLVAQVWPCGDHIVLVGDVVAGSAERLDAPLLLYDGEFCKPAGQEAVHGGSTAPAVCALRLW
ncbi:flavin reductase family protein [Geodermatophilus sp. YIM 151500]|uniref:flavin reductase family protein n=1 Tax=Geodermatophilus sp. YIM 151500 TaxID=2984531 RepID=UPI0021E4DA24|nr:flavin reductase family protein [Geodermatophilus sp. YIM 151500]MCV2490977.1 flavin reductase family protein [Geodermatophilus sp. YIM 151500]